ncbi:Uncharacterized protein FKW44_016698 [Caligus rogercresseyi]|uniref:Uncharacterized protein n=1 Tax=Caligus rogercresseyi TaxID=217165 RepID=A0A7T8K0M9_CALRO|nr:Uncharacterized protein FKW44_016698 [Caligus rogercresseyi]
MEKRKREAVVELVRAGHGAKAIKDITVYASSIVYDVVKAFKGSGDVFKKLQDRFGTKKRTQTFLAGFKRLVTANPGTPMSFLAKKCNVSKATVSRAVKELNIISY